MPQTIFTFLGAPGSGKGTLAEQIVTHLGFLSVSTGDLLRQAVTHQTNIGKKVQSYMRQGKLVPDEIVTQLMKEWLDKHKDAITSIILDGYPRTAQQAAHFFRVMKDVFPQIPLRVVELTIPDETIIQRIADRLVCEKCSHVYSRVLLKDTKVCPACGGALIRREDDKKDVVRERLKVYCQTHDDLVKFYSSAGIPVEQLHVAGKSVDQVFNDFKNLLRYSRG